MYVVKYTNKIDVSRLNENQSTKSIWVKSDGTVVDMDLVTTVIEAVMQDLNKNFRSIEEVIRHKDIIYTDDPYIETMATDGVSIFINPAYAEYLINKDENNGPLYVEYVLTHEALHILFDHCNQHNANVDKFSDPEKVNYAQDYEINYTIENFLREGMGTTPFKGKTKEIGGLYNDEFGRKGLTWEDIYSQLPAIQREKKLKPTSDKWKEGFADGYAEIINKLRKQSLIEKCVTM